ncbi:MAG: hypothetical protein B6242_01445 [Anaerolineaceae bacterium 4572_78]|nr:MAG: hypothetical protein B6242_01445 [Anaerolineaceae bacterium 4572_78]
MNLFAQYTEPSTVHSFGIDELRGLIFDPIKFGTGYIPTVAMNVLYQHNMPDSTVVLVEAFLESPNGSIRRRAKEMLQRSHSQACIDKVCQIWADTQNNDLSELLRKQRWIASEPMSLRILTALKARRFEELYRGNWHIVDPLYELCHDENPTIARRARRVLARLQNQRAIEYLCWIWQYQKYDQFLGEIITEAGYMPQSPPDVRTLVIFHLNQTDMLFGEGAEIVPHLLKVCRETHADFAEKARTVLLNLEKEAAKDALFDAFIEENDKIAYEIISKIDYLPRVPQKQAIFFFMTEQWERYETLDFTHSILRSVYEKAKLALRNHIRKKLRKSGRKDYISIISGTSNQYIHNMTDDDINFFVQTLIEYQAWDKLWLLVFEVSLIHSIKIVRTLAEQDWQPKHGDERVVFVSLRELVTNDMVTDIKEVRKYIKPAIKCATAKVKNRINDVAFSPTQPIIAIGTGIKKVALWNFQKGEMENVLSMSKGSIGRVTFMPNNMLLATERIRLSRGDVHIYGWHDGEQFTLGQLRSSVTSINAIDDNTVLTTGRDQTLVTWDVNSRTEICRQELDFWARGVAFPLMDTDSDTPHEIALFHRGINLFGLSDLSEIASTSRNNSDMKIILCGTFTPDGQEFVAGNFNGYLDIWQLNRQKRFIRRHSWGFNAKKHSEVDIGQTRAVRLFPKRNLLLSAYSKGLVMIQHWANGDVWKSIPIEGKVLTSLTISQNGDFMAIGNSNASMSLWDLRAMDVPPIFEQPLAKTVPSYLPVVISLANNTSVYTPMRRSLKFIEHILRYRFRYDIEIDTIPTIRVGEFDIEIE